VIYGEVATDTAAGARLVHRQRAGAKSFAKGHLLTAEDVAALQGAGVERVTVVRFEPGDIGEDAAADIVAKAATGEGLEPGPAYTGRVNLHAATASCCSTRRASMRSTGSIPPSPSLRWHPMPWSRPSRWSPP
jgi:molybdenum cofactor cytidylyltransferase